MDKDLDLGAESNEIFLHHGVNFSQVPDELIPWDMLYLVAKNANYAFGGRFYMKDDSGQLMFFSKWYDEERRSTDLIFGYNARISQTEFTDLHVRVAFTYDMEKGKRYVDIIEIYSY